MTSAPSPRVALPQWLIPILVFAGLAGLVMLSNRPALTPLGVPVVRDNAEYKQRSDEALELCRKPLESFGETVELSETQRTDVEKAYKIYDAMFRFSPLAVEPPFQAGRCAYLLGDLREAEDLITQSIYNAEQGIKQNAQSSDKSTIKNIQLTMAEAQYSLGLVYIKAELYEKAVGALDAAIQTVPNSPAYLAARGSAFIQLKKLPEAMRDVATALALDPKHARSIQLAKLIDAEVKANGGKP
jgi:tetratricopeptide (TPR) repeat protein